MRFRTVKGLALPHADRCAIAKCRRNAGNPAINPPARDTFPIADGRAVPSVSIPDGSVFSRMAPYEIFDGTVRVIRCAVRKKNSATTIVR